MILRHDAIGFAIPMQVDAKSHRMIRAKLKIQQPVGSAQEITIQPL